MDVPYKVEVTMQYTEVVYYDAHGNEVARDELRDARSYDASSKIPLTEEEIEDWIVFNPFL